MSDSRNFLIRPYEPSDRAQVRHLCCETGFLGNPIDAVFEDRELFADYLTQYYLDHEPESSFVILVNGELKGYLLGSRRPHKHQFFGFFQNISLVSRGLVRYPGYNAASKKFVHWILCNGWREVPAAPRNVPHFHINLLAEARNVPTTRAIMDAYLAYLYKCGEKQVCGQMVTFHNRRGTKMFERYGFKVINRAEITKYRDLHPEPVYLSTVLKDLTENSQLYSARAD
ncbi:MAG TPA: hypothetical protein VF585_08730 [Chthoniobacterales bacterium]|jgi:ribosomal protein S18 acetylase RimI-like enzyme